MTCCPLSSGDGDACSFYSQTTVAARKEHQCCECREVIASGARYEKVVGCWDGIFSTYKTCMSCVEIRNHFACGNGWLFECLWDDLETNFFPDMKAGGPCMEGLSPAVKQRLIDKRMEWYMDHEHDGAPPRSSAS